MHPQLLISFPLREVKQKEDKKIYMKKKAYLQWEQTKLWEKINSMYMYTEQAEEDSRVVR